MAEIVGYRQLEPSEIQTVNRIKDAGERLELLLDDIGRMSGVDQRWLAIGKTHLQVGFMAVTRSVTKPETFA